MTQPTFIEIIETAAELATDEGNSELAFIFRCYPKDPTNRHCARWTQLIDKASWVLRERTKANEQLAA